MTRHSARAIAVAALALLVAACQTGTVVLLPEKDGKDTAIVVKQRDGEVTLREPYAAATFSNTGPRVYQSSKDDVAAQFGRALDARPERPVEFTLLLRVPATAHGVRVLHTGMGDGADAGHGLDQGGWLPIRRVWQRGDGVSLELSWQPRAEPYPNGEFAVFRGPVQYVLPLEHRLTAIRDYPGTDLHDYDVVPTDITQGYRIPGLRQGSRAAAVDLAHEARDGDPDRPWDEPRSVLRAGAATLVPMGCTILRRAAFPIR